jgi:hypothetical protein
MYFSKKCKQTALISRPRNNSNNFYRAVTGKKRRNGKHKLIEVLCCLQGLTLGLASELTENLSQPS